MSISELNNTKNLGNESARSIHITPENPYNAIDMELVKKETETPGSLPIAKLKSFVSIDIIENNIERRTNTNEEVDARISENISDLKVHVIPPEDARKKSTIKEFYDCMVDFGNPQRLERQIRRQKRSPQLPVTMHHGHIIMGHVYLTKSQDPLQARGYPPGSGSLHSQGYPQEEYQGNVARLKGGFGPDDRSAFVILVLTITFIMLACTATFVGIVMLVPEFRDFFKAGMLYVFIPATITLIMVQAVFAYSQCARRPPCNFLLLVIAVIALSSMAATVTSRYKMDIIFQAILITTIIVGVCVVLACTGFDFTSYMIYVIVISLLVSLIGITYLSVRLITGEKFTILRLILLVVGTTVQSMVLIIELQLILGGKAVELDEREYALGAFYLYSSIVNIFLKMLALIGEED